MAIDELEDRIVTLFDVGHMPCLGPLFVASPQVPIIDPLDHV